MAPSISKGIGLPGLNVKAISCGPIFSSNMCREARAAFSRSSGTTKSKTLRPTRLWALAAPFRRTATLTRDITLEDRPDDQVRIEATSLR
jgi:hypothetical protein